MLRTQATGGRMLTIALQTIVTNPANSGEIRTYEATLSNQDGVNAANVTRFERVDASEANAAQPLLAKDYPIKAKDQASGLVVLDPGDSLRASASADGDIFLSIQQRFAEPAT